MAAPSSLEEILAENSEYLLDHVNGDRGDQRLESLRLLCPTRHSQTETYCGRNQGRYASDGSDRCAVP